MEITTAALRSLAKGTGEERKKKHSDLHPLPLGWSAEDAAWDVKAGSPLKVIEDDSAEAREASKRAWVQAAVLALNTLYEAPKSLDRDESQSTFRGLTAKPGQANERISLMKLDAKVEKFMERSGKENSKVTKDWPTLFKSRVAGHKGGVVAKIQELT